MGEYKVIYEMVANTMKQLQEIVDEHDLTPEEQVDFFKDMQTSISDDIDWKILQLKTKPEVKSKLQLLNNELKDFDYTYEHSDDHSYWQAGVTNSKRIQRLIDDLHPSLHQNAKNLIDKYRVECGHVFTIPEA